MQSKGKVEVQDEAELLNLNLKQVLTSGIGCLGSREQVECLSIGL
jgi:hypothetical protein